MSSIEAYINDDNVRLDPRFRDQLDETADLVTNSGRLRSIPVYIDLFDTHLTRHYSDKNHPRTLRSISTYSSTMPATSAQATWIRSSTRPPS